MRVKAACKTLVKLTPGLNVINILSTAFTHTYPESLKDADDLTVFFYLSGSMSVKALRKMLVKLTPGLSYPY